MGLSPELVEKIKGHLAKKPSAELRAILEARDTAKMSDEAFAAAETILAERARGDAVEPGPEMAVAPPPLTPRLPSHALARGLVWVLRGVALLAAISGLIEISDAVSTRRVASDAAKQLRTISGAEGVSAEVERAGTKGVFTSAVTAAGLVAVLLALAEGLRLCILIAGNTQGEPATGEGIGDPADPVAAADGGREAGS